MKHPAYLGLEVHHGIGAPLQRQILIKCCAWHDGREEVEKAAQLLNLEVSHGICVDCGITMQREIDIYRNTKDLDPID